MRNYSPSHDELHIDPSEFAENRLYMIEGGEYDFDLAERELAEEELGTVPDESGETNPTRLTREDRELFYDPPLREPAGLVHAARSRLPLPGLRREGPVHQDHFLLRGPPGFRGCEVHGPRRVLRDKPH
jgi:hypothetical protein